MSLFEPIGGYFELELPAEGPWLHSESILLNTGRACIEYVVRAFSPAKVHVPYYTCDVVVEPLEREQVPYSFYHVNETLEIEGDLAIEGDELLLYTNYFGLKSSYCTALAERYGSNLLLDCSQALFFPPPQKCHTFYSPRKFVGAPDGGCLYTNFRLDEPLLPDQSQERYRHLIGRNDVGAEAGYDWFKVADAALQNQPLKQMSPSTRRLLASVDYESMAATRRSNYEQLAIALAPYNQLELISGEADVPMVYPIIAKDQGLRQHLISAKVFVATYWPNVLRWCDDNGVEAKLATEIVPLPIDQRYGPAHMEQIVRRVLEHVS